MRADADDGDDDGDSSSSSSNSIGKRTPIEKRPGSRLIARSDKHPTHLVSFNLRPKRPPLLLPTGWARQ